MSGSWTHFRLDRRSPSYWRVTFDHPPINTITATTVSELSELVALIERDTRLNVVVFGSASPDFFLAQGVHLNGSVARSRLTPSCGKWKRTHKRKIREAVMSTNAVRGKETISNVSTAKVAMKGEAVVRPVDRHTRGRLGMKSKRIPAVTVAVVLAVLGLSLAAQDKQDKYTLQVPGGLAFSEFRGYEDWQTVAVSQSAAGINVILANKVMTDAYRAGVPGNGKPFPDGSKTVKIAWKPEKSTDAPDPATVVPGTLNGVGFMVRDSKRFADSGGWGWAQFKYDAASDRFTPFTAADKPPQRNDAKCGLACHTIAKEKDYVFTAYKKK